jgi:hypothetical protein
MTLETTLIPAIGEWFVNIVGGNIMLAILIGLAGFGAIMQKLQIGLAPAMMISIFVIGVLYFETSTSGISGVTGSQVNVLQVLFFLLIVGVALFVVKRWRDG